MTKEQTYEKALKGIRILYVLISLCVVFFGILQKDVYMTVNGLGTLALLPGLWLLRKLLRLRGGFALEVWIYVFICMSWTVGGAAGVYSLLPGYDKVVHALSGVFVSMVALAGYRLLEPESLQNGKYSPSVYLFVFFASMGTASLFEICEFTLAPLISRDLQHVLDTGVVDTMLDMIVCLGGTLLYLLLMVRRSHGKRDPLTDTAEGLQSELTQKA